MAEEPKSDPPKSDPPKSDDTGPDPWERLGSIVEEKIKGVFAGHVADHHTAPTNDDGKGTKKSDATVPPVAGAEGDKVTPPSGDDRGWLAKAFGF